MERRRAPIEGSPPAKSVGGILGRVKDYVRKTYQKARRLVVWLLVMGKKLRARLQYQHSWHALEQRLGERSPEYEQYLSVQLRRTVTKLGATVSQRVRILVDLVAQFVDLGRCSVLCIGSRGGAEIDCLLERGVKEVVGIDLQSHHDKVLIMDMHELEFPADSFDVIYCSHSLEHAFDIERVVKEIVRVSKAGAVIVVEVPVQFEPRGADLIDFESIQGLHSVFGQHISEVLCAEHYRPHSETNDSGTAVVRSVFRIDGVLPD